MPSSTNARCASPTASRRPGCAPATASHCASRTPPTSSRSSGPPNGPASDYTPINARLTTAEADYIAADCGARAVVVSGARPDLAGLAESVTCRLWLGDDPPAGWEQYDEALAAQPVDPVYDEREGIDMLYSSGTTGRPKGVRRTRRDVPAGTPDNAVFLDARRVRLRRRHRVPVDRAAAPRRAADPEHGDPPARRHRRGDGALRPDPGAGPDRAPRRDPQPVGAHDVRATAQAGARRAAAVRSRQSPPGDPRRRPLPDRGQGADDRLVGADPVRLLLGDRGRRHVRDHVGRVADPQGFGRSSRHRLGARRRRRRPRARAGDDRHGLLRRRSGVRVPQRSRQDGGDPQRGRLVDARRHRAPRRRRLPLPHRPRGVHDRLGRRRTSTRRRSRTC